MKWWYLSFAEDGFKGACIVEAEDFLAAVEEAHRRKINPGGQVFGQPVPEDAVYDPSYRNRLLTREDLQAMLPHEEIMTERERAARKEQN